MSNSFPYATPEKILAACSSIGSIFIGPQEVTILKQLLISIATRITPPQEILIVAPEGAYAGATLIATGGTPVAYEVGEYTPIIEDVGMIIIPYMFIINGVETGEWFISPTTLPDDLEEGDTIQVKDAIGRLSNVLIATTNPLYSLTYTGQTLTYTGQTLTYNP